MNEDIDGNPLPEPEPYVLEREACDRLIIMGDANGYAHLFDRLLFGVGLIDLDGHWSGGDAVLVQLGDLINRGSSSRATMDRILRLRVEARAQGGDVIWLLGNHEVMTALGHEAYVTADEYLEFAEVAEIDAYLEQRSRRVQTVLAPPKTPRRVAPIGGLMKAWEEEHAPGQERFRDAMSSSGIYGRHLRALPAAIRVGSVLCVHGGLSPRWAAEGLEGVAARVASVWADDPPAYHSLEPGAPLRDPDGPIWHRAYCLSDAAEVGSELKEVLAATGTEVMVVGHTRTESAGGSSGHPLTRWQDRLVMADVGMGEPGEPGCVLIVEDGTLDMWSPIDGRSQLMELSE